jgi:hypothetical protein
MPIIISIHPDGGFIAAVDGVQIGPRADTLGEAIATAAWLARGPMRLTEAAERHTPHHGMTDAEAIELLARTLVDWEAENGPAHYSDIYQRGWPPADIDRLGDRARIRAEHIKAARGQDAGTGASTGRAA